MHPIKVTEKKNDKNNKYKYINYEIKKTMEIQSSMAERADLNLAKLGS